MVDRLRQGQGRDANHSVPRSFRNFASALRTWLCLLLLAATAVCGLAGCTASTSATGSAGSAASTGPATPTIDSLSAAFGAVGTSLTITGANFGATQGTSSLTFNSTAATVNSWSATSLVVTVPLGATTGNIVVTVSGVSSSGVNFVVPALVSALSPASGAIGTSITISGSNFGATQGTSSVAFNGALAPVISWSATSIVTSVPFAATTGNVVVTVSGIASAGPNFLLPPIVTSLSVASGAVGTSLTITGSNFGAAQGTSSVAFNGALAQVLSWSATSILTSVPPAATTGNVIVTVSGIASAGSNFVVPPIVTALSATSGAIGTSLTITGSNFGANQGTSSVAFNGALAPVVSWTSTTIVTTVPLAASTGSVTVTVSGIATTGPNFVVPPVLTALSAASGAVSTNITITGFSFGATQGTNSVTFNGISAAVVTWAGTSITATVPFGSTPGNVLVTVAGVASNGLPFAPGPSIGSLSENSGPAGTATTITGVNFGATQGVSTVTFDGVPASATAWANTSITVVVPVGATTGPLTVEVNSLLSNGVTFSVVSSNVLPGCGNSPTGDESMLSGHYVFLIQGWTGPNPSSTITSFIANGSGGITGGEGDSSSAILGAQHFLILPTGGGYTVGKDPTGTTDIGCVVLPNSLGAFTTLTFALGKLSGSVYTKGRIIQFDQSTGAGTRASGVLLRQTPPFVFPGASQNFVFGENGFDAENQSFDRAGHLTMSTTGVFTNLISDFDDDGTVDYGNGTGSPVLGAPSSGGFSAAPDATAGYATVTEHYLLGTTTFVQTFHYAAYQVNANEYFYLSTDPQSDVNPLVSGRAIATIASFTNSSLNGNYVLHQTGTDSAVSAEIGLGLLTFTPANPSGAIHGTLYQYEEGSALATETPSATYAINASLGRAILTNASGFGVSNDVPVLYIATPAPGTEPISAFVVGTGLDSSFGFLEASSGTFTTAGMAGNYFFGTEDPGDRTITDQIGSTAVTGAAGACSGTAYSSAINGLSVSAVVSCTVTITNSNGLGNVGAGTTAIANGEAIFFVDQGATPGANPAVIDVIEKQ